MCTSHRVCPGCDHMVVVLTASLPVQSAPITTKVVSLNTVHFEVYSIQQYALKLVSDLRQGRWFYPGTLVSSINKTDRQDITENQILLKVALITIKLTLTLY